MTEMTDWIRRAADERWAIGEFNISGLETLQAVIMTAERDRSPVIVGTSMGTIRHLGFDWAQVLCASARERSGVPVFVHLDHGTEEMAYRCIDAGWDSVMIDVSELPYAENTRVTREVAEYGRARGVLVEAQIGQTWDEEGEREVEQIDTDPAEAQTFVHATGVDLLAVSIGNTPGSTDGGEAQIKIETLEQIADVVSVPTVLHGGTSINDDIVRRTIALGVAKVNIDTALRRAMATTIAEDYAASDFPFDTRPTLARARDRAADAVSEKIALVGSANRA